MPAAPASPAARSDAFRDGFLIRGGGIAPALDGTHREQDSDEEERRHHERNRGDQLAMIGEQGHGSCHAVTSGPIGDDSRRSVAVS